MSKARIQVCIPIHNNADSIDATIESIWNQNYDKDDIYVIAVDFSSTDGTYEKLLKYDRFHFGIYRDDYTKNPRQYMSKVQGIAAYQYPGGMHCFSILLYPGDILYKNYMKVCTDELIRYQRIKPARLLCEVNFFGKNGEIYSQNPLYPQNRIIDGRKEIYEYTGRGYRHLVQCMGYGFMQGANRFICEANEQRWWNKFARLNNEVPVVYVKEPLACVYPIEYVDELEEILLRWEAIISFIRGNELKYEKAVGQEWKKDALKNLAEYSIWRAFLLLGIDKKMSEDCFTISSVIDSTICSSEIYVRMSRFLSSNKRQDYQFIEDYFMKHGMN